MPTAAEELGAYESDPQVAWDLVIFANSPSLPFLDVFFIGRQVIPRYFVSTGGYMMFSWHLGKKKWRNSAAI